MTTTQAVIGLGFGDEGKGLVTDYLCLHNPQSLVVRFNGGHQAGHTVCLPEGKRHVFSNFGSGTLRRVPTYWSKYCTIHPPAIVREFKQLLSIGAKPTLFIDNFCLVTTPYDILYNQNLEKEREQRHGSCGVGFGATIERSERGHVLFARDLKSISIVEMWLGKIAKCYSMDRMREEEKEFIDSVVEFNHIVTLVTENMILSHPKWKNIIFEGAQGILLDMHYGSFPYVTRSNTTSKNAIEIIKRNNLGLPTIYYVTRAYQTRHGAGPMTNEILDPFITLDEEKETNKFNEWQEYLRYGVLDVSKLHYSIACDQVFSKDCKHNIVITCLDQMSEKIFYTVDEELKSTDDWGYLSNLILPKRYRLFSFSPYAENVSEHQPLAFVIS